MPLNQKSLTYYSANYKDLREYLYSNIPLLFNSQATQKQYISQWISLLQECDKQDSAIIKNAETFSNLCKEIKREPEIFQQKLYVGNNVFYLHYRITFLKSLLKQLQKNSAILVETSEYSSTPPSIFWNYPDDFNTKYPINNEPVIAVEFPDTGADYLIIDGNHRIAKHIADNSPSIPTYFFNVSQVYYYKILGMSFDLALYILQNDVSNLSTQKAKANFSDSMIYFFSSFRST